MTDLRIVRDDDSEFERAADLIRSFHTVEAIAARQQDELVDDELCDPLWNQDTLVERYGDGI